MDIQKYSTRPDEVEAVQLTLENIEDVADWCGGEIISESKASDHKDVYTALTVPRANGPIDAQIGMYILKNSRGRFEVMRNNAFQEKYGAASGIPERVEELLKKAQGQDIISAEEALDLVREKGWLIPLEPSEEVSQRADEDMFGRLKARDTFFGRPSL